MIKQGGTNQSLGVWKNANTCSWIKEIEYHDSFVFTYIYFKTEKKTFKQTVKFYVYPKKQDF